MIYRITTQGHNGTEIETLRYATHGHYDDDGNYYEPRLTNPGNYSRSMFSSGTTRGESSVGVGEIVVDNLDGALDRIKGWGFSGRSVLIEKLEAEGATPTLVWKGTVEQPVVGLKEVQFRVRDRLEDLRKALQQNRFAGTTIAGGMAECEGRPDDLKDQPKPLPFGSVFNVPASPGNVYDLIYQVRDGAVAGIPFVFDKGVQLTNANQDYATLAALRAATIPAGKYATCLALGCFRLGGSPAGQITADVIVGSTTAERSVGSIVRQILTRAGIAVEDQPDLSGLPDYEVGLWIADETTALSAITQIIGSVGGYFISTRTGGFAVGVFRAPATPTFELDAADILDITAKVPSEDGKGVPPWRVVVRWGRNWSVQSESELGDKSICVSNARKAFVAKEYREAVAENASIKVRHPNAPEIIIETMLTTEEKAKAEAARWLALYGGVADMLDVSVEPEIAGAFELGQTIRITYPRLGMENGADYVVTGLTEDYGGNIGSIEVWRVIP